MEEIKRISDSELNVCGGSKDDQRGEIIRVGTASVSLPVIGQVVDLKGSLELQTDVRVE